MKKFLPSSLPFGVNFKGFTLVELLVVISIIAILSVIGITLFGNVQKNARDARRKGDIEAISKALETNYVSGSTTPYQIVTAAQFASGAIPADPQTNVSYAGVPTAAAATYTVCATLENTTGNATSSVGAGLGSTSTGSHYCRKNAQ